MKKNLLKLFLISIGLQLCFVAIAQDNITPMPDGLYFAVKNGNICYFDGEKVVDTQIYAGAHAFQLASWHGAIYGVNAGEQFTYINDINNSLGDGELFVINKWSNGEFKKSTIVNNTKLEEGGYYNAYLDPYYIMIDNDSIYYACREFSIGGIRVFPAKEIYETPSMTSDDVPIFAKADKLPYYNRGFAYAAIHGGLQRDSEGIYWHALGFNGNGIYRYKQSDIYKTSSQAQSASMPYSTIAYGIQPSAMFLDEKNGYIYIYNITDHYEDITNCGVFRLPISAINSNNHLREWERIDESPAMSESTTVTEGSFVRQFTSDGDYVYWAYIAEEGSGYKSGIKRVNATGTPKVEYVVEDIEAYGICSYKYDGSLGIENIKIENDGNTIEIARYDIYGRKLSRPTKGINIIKMSDGSTHKEYVK